MNKSPLLLAPAAGALAALALLTGADWPAWRGPDRTDVSKETGLLKTWPKGGPKLLWTFEHAGVGYAGPAVIGEYLYTMGAEDDKEYVYALDLKTRKKAWNTEIGAMLTNDWGDGPRGTPTVDGERIYCLSALGNLVCVERGGGKPVWSLSLTKDLGGELPTWGYTESPLVDGDRLIVSPGGGEGGVVALNKKDGKVEWQCKELTDPAAYSSAIVAEVGGVRQYIQLTMRGVAGIAAKDGKLLWYQPKKEFRTAVIPTPICKDNFVYFTAGYMAGCELVKLTADGDKFKVTSVYANRNLENHHGGVVLLGDHLYGYGEGKGWVCQDFKTGEVVWSDNSLEKGSLTCADGRLYCYGQRGGICKLVEASPKAWKECGSLEIPRQTKLRASRGGIWTHPVVANGKLYLRDQDLIFCYDVKDGK
jgi:outer membrane protein assembly factor BamB